MGNCGSGSSAHDAVSAGDLRSHEVEEMLRRAEEETAREVKVLLLGAGESGKSTVVKQIKLLYKGGIPAKEREEYARNIRRNAIESIQTLVEACATLGIEIADENNQLIASNLMEMDSDASLELGLASEIAALWRDEGIQEAYARRAEFWLLDAASYYLENIFRLGEEDFSPTEEDMIMTRVRTSGIVVTEFDDAPTGLNFKIVDVGGQRNERRKWIHCFDDVKAIIFLGSLIAYNQVLFEDQTRNRLLESLQLFSDVVGNPLFKDVPVFLFLNKKDLFETMIREVSLDTIYPDYEGGHDMDTALEFLQEEYRRRMEEKCPGKELYIHIIAARVRMDMKIAFGEVKDVIKDMLNSKKGKRRK